MIIYGELTIIKVKTLVFCDFYEYGDVYIMCRTFPFCGAVSRCIFRLLEVFYFFILISPLGFIDNSFHLFCKQQGSNLSDMEHMCNIEVRFRNFCPSSVAL